MKVLVYETGDRWCVQCQFPLSTTFEYVDSKQGAKELAEHLKLTTVGRPVASHKVRLNREDRVELYHMLRGRGGSALKDKLLAALEALDPQRAALLRGETS